jgi:hypothetical protein
MAIMGRGREGKNNCMVERKDIDEIIRGDYISTCEREKIS